MTSEEAARLCAEHGLSREETAADWKVLFSPPEEGSILELGAGFGDDTLELAADCPGRTIAVVPDRDDAARIERRLAAAGRKAEVRTAESLDRLPDADGSVAGIAYETVAAFGSTDPIAMCREWRRVLRPGGRVFVGGDVSPLLDRARRLVGRPAGETLNRFVKAAPGATPTPLDAIERAMTAAGFAPPERFAPLPSPRKIDVVVPLGSAGCLRFFLNRMVRRSTPAVRIGVRAARTAVALGQFERMVPHVYLFYTAPTE